MLGLESEKKMSISMPQSGAQSATFYVANALENSETLTTTEWEALPKGKLKDLLNTTYLTEAGDIDPAAFVQAFATAGAFLTGNSYGTTNTENGTWTLSPGGEGEPAKGSPKLEVDWNQFGTVIRIVTSYSASE